MESAAGTERAILVGFGPRGTLTQHLEDSLDELGRLVHSAGGEVVGRVLQRGRPHAAHLVGTGKLAEIGRLASHTDADMVVFDDELSPSQIVNLEKRLDCKIIDRSMLILSIFARACAHQGSEDPGRIGAIPVSLSSVDGGSGRICPGTSVGSAPGAGGNPVGNRSAVGGQTYPETQALPQGNR